MARRWINRDPGRIHSLALPDQSDSVAESLAAAVRDSGGDIFAPPLGSSLLQRAIWLRQTAYEKADCVVLHISNADVVASTAFGVDGGPPVLLVNHAAHTFWTGAPMVDVVLNCRGSEFERFWTRRYRGVSNGATLPIPIEPPQEISNSDQVFTSECRARARRRLNIPADAVVLLSVGREEKYHPVGGLDFFGTVRALLTECPNVWMLVVGPEETEERSRLSGQLNGRLKVLGLQFELRDYYAASDVYMESFPFGSTTAFLEAGVHGLPCVLAPASCPPPFGTDGIALDHEYRPANVAEYVARVKELIADSRERSRRGASLARSIREHHCAEGWSRYYSELLEQIPAVHRLSPIAQPPSPPEPYDEYWALTNGVFKMDPFSSVFMSGLAAGLTPKLDFALFKACRAAKQSRRRQGFLQSAVPLVFSAFLRVFPAVSGKFLYRQMMRLWDFKRAVKSFVRRSAAAPSPSPSAAPAE
jgi:glycosyltransferase involved in cell wall biosynthesis